MKLVMLARAITANVVENMVEGFLFFIYFFNRLLVSSRSCGVVREKAKWVRLGQARFDTSPGFGSGEHGSKVPLLMVGWLYYESHWFIRSVVSPPFLPGFYV